MKIQPIIQNSMSFRGANVSINAFSDTHGELLLADKAFEEMKDRKDDIFLKEEKGNANVFAVSGDWCMDGGKKGYKTNPDRPLALFQADILNGFVQNLQNLAGNITSLFTPGNHEFDGGIDLFKQTVDELEPEIVMTNLDRNKTPDLKNKVLNQKIVEVEDDKNPDKTHKILFLGISPVNMYAYQKKFDGVTLLDNVDKPQSSVTPNDYQKTFNDCKRKIAAFKHENPKGAVVLMSHTGVEFADNLAKEAPVDLVLDGHEHKNDIRVVNDTPIIPLSKNFKKIVNAKIHFDDNGNANVSQIQEFSPLNNPKTGVVGQMFNEIFKEDVKPKYVVKSVKESVRELSTKHIKSENNFLANMVTDTLLFELRKTNPDVDFFALNACAIRHPINISSEDKASVSDFDVQNVVSGVKESDAKIFISELSGLDITYLVADNYISNKNNPKKNPLVHYSGIIADRTNLIKAYENGADYSELSKYVLDERTRKPVDCSKKYKIANIEKYFNKSQNGLIRDLKDYSVDSGLDIKTLFKQHFEEGESTEARCDVRVF